MTESELLKQKLAELRDLFDADGRALMKAHAKIERLEAAGAAAAKTAFDSRTALYEALSYIIHDAACTCGCLEICNRLLSLANGEQVDDY